MAWSVKDTRIRNAELELIKYTQEFEVSLVELINKQKEYNYYNKKVIELENSVVLKYPSKYDFNLKFINLKFINLNKVYLFK